MRNLQRSPSQKPALAREGSIARASEELRLAHPTIRGRSIGSRTPSARSCSPAADAGWCSPTRGASRSATPTRSSRSGARFLEPAFRLGDAVHVICRADKSVEEFVAELALHRVDVVIADGPAGGSIPVRTFSHLLGECGTTFFAAAKLAATTRRAFPRSLEGAPFLLPGAPSMARRALEQWFHSEDLRPRIVGEFDDSALAKEFGKEGMGVFAAPTVIEAEVSHQYGVRVVGRAESVRQQFYAISIERKIKHPAVVAIREVARNDIFAGR
jgi:LysR family transcriptional regulator, transcriptional activator of nhaA